MTDIQPRDESAENSSNDEPLSEMMKRKRAPERTRYSKEAHTKKLSDSEDDEPLLTLMKKRKNKKKAETEETAVLDKKELSDSEDDEPLLMLMKKRKNKKPGTEETAVLDSKTRSPRKQKTEAKTTKHRQSSPSQVKTPQKRGRKGKRETRKAASANSTPEKTPPKKRGCAKKQATERQAPSCDSSDNEPLVQLVKKKRQPAMKRAVVLLKRMSNRDIIDTITRGHKCSQVQSSTGKADVKSEVESSDEEPLSHKVKRLKQHSKPVRGRTTAGLV